MWRRRKAPVSRELSPKELSALMSAAQVTGDEITQWHQDFLDHYPSGRMNKDAFITYYRKLFPNMEVTDSIDTFFERADMDHDGTVDFNELLVLIVLMSRLTDLESRLAFAFDMWDGSENGFIEREELANVLTAIYDRAGVRDRRGDRDPKKRAEAIIAQLDISGDKKLSKEEFITGCKNDSFIRNLLAPNA